MLTGAGSRKTRLIEAAGFSLMVGRASPTVRYVAVDGPVSRVDAGADEQLVELTQRYLPHCRGVAVNDWPERAAGGDAERTPGSDQLLIGRRRTRHVSAS